MVEDQVPPTFMKHHSCLFTTNYKQLSCSYNLKKYAFFIQPLTLISTDSFPHLEAVAWSVGVLLSFWCGAPPGWLSDDSAGSLESSQLRPHGLAWLEPSWCDTIVSQAWVCSCRSVGVLVCVAASACVHGFRVWLYVCMHSDVCTYLHVHTHTFEQVCVCTRVCVCACVCLLPSAPSNRLIFHISHGQEGQEAARLRPEPGYSTVSNARHSLAPPKLSALLPNALAS